MLPGAIICCAINEFILNFSDLFFQRRWLLWGSLLCIVGKKDILCHLHLQQFNKTLIWLIFAWLPLPWSHPENCNRVSDLKLRLFFTAAAVARPWLIEVGGIEVASVINRRGLAHSGSWFVWQVLNLPSRHWYSCNWNCWGNQPVTKHRWRWGNQPVMPGASAGSHNPKVIIFHATVCKTSCSNYLTSDNKWVK